MRSRAVREHQVVADRGNQQTFAVGEVVAREAHPDTPLDERESPEVRRCPEEDDGEQVDGREVDMAGYRRSAHEGRKGAGCHANDDVPRARAFEPDGIDQHVPHEPA